MPSDRIDSLHDGSTPGLPKINLARHGPIHLAALTIDPAARRLRHDDGRVAILEPRMMQVFVALADADGATLSRDDLIACCWDGRFVGDEAISSVIYRLRKTLKDFAADTIQIETIPKIGFRLVTESLQGRTRLFLKPLRPHRRSPEHLPGGLSSTSGTPSNPFLGVSRLWLAVLIFLVLGGMVGAGFFIWDRHASGSRITIAVAAAANSPDRVTATDYANLTIADLAAFLPIHTDKVVVVSPSDPRSGRSDYRMEIASGRQGTSTDATVTLSDATTGDVFWSKSWNVPNATPGELRQPISLAASHAMLCLLDTISGAQRLRQPALGMYMSGCAGFDDPTRSDADTQGFLEHAVQLAPNFGPGWAWLAVERAGNARDSEGKIDPAAAAKAQQAIAMARKLDPSNAKVFLAEVFLTDDQLRGLALLEKGTALDPNDALIQASLSYELRSVGRLTDAVSAGRRAVELDPYSPWGVITYIFTLRVAGQVKEMEDEIAKARKMWGETQTADANDFMYAIWYGDPRRAEALLPSLDVGEFDTEAFRRTITARLNPTPANVDAALILYRQEMQRTPAHRGGQYLLMLGVFGRTDDAFALLTDKSFQKGFAGWEILFTPALAHVRNDPRFMRVAADLGLLNYWRRSGHWPDFCSDPRLPYDCKAEAAKYV